MKPGGPAIVLSGDFINTNADPVAIHGVAATITTVEPLLAAGTSACSPSNFTIEGVATFSPNVPVGGTAQTGVGSWTGQTIRLMETAANQDVCKDVRVNVVYALLATPTIEGVGHIVALDTGSCNNDWATDTFDKHFRLDNNGNGTYALKVDYLNGSFVSIGGAKAPGACNTGVDNGSTVAAGVTGSQTQQWGATLAVSAAMTAVQNEHPDCSANKCTNLTGFLTQVFGAANTVAHPTMADYTWTGSFNAGTHGTWFDTQVPGSIVWPLGDHGNIQ
jgi:hypothetical protein